jgi:hypothetical protein
MICCENTREPSTCIKENWNVNRAPASAQNLNQLKRKAHMIVLYANIKINIAKTHAANLSLLIMQLRHHTLN